MRYPHPQPIRTALGAALAVTTLFGAAACGTGGTAGNAAPQSGTSQIAVATPSQRTDVQKELRKLEASFKGRIGAYALDTATGATITHRGDERFGMASTFKAMVAAAVLDKARRFDPGLLDRLIRWEQSDLVSNSPVTEKHVDTGLTVAQLCHAAVTVSDNTAGNLLLKQIGGPAGLTRYFRTLGDPVSRLDRWETELNEWSPGEKRDTTMPAFMGRNLAKLTTGSALAEPDRARLIGWLRANTTGDRRIRAGLPKDWTVGDKTGTPGAYGGAHDIAIAWPPSGAPLIIAVYTNRLAADGASDDSVVATTATILARGLGKMS
ncbi:class A beta-lactamase [Actinomadura sp. HBU206391]|uniref:class A beta-lactamase n=1 Tax=Actinomadura sp. HBU206391 TaxID=2731692 RepID=UPI00164FFFC8|nr:class A beta-lactamase [Actinomadura sp. HBU206391]MBC6460134.1 class A beta-lactamase [Actinomadura sp. HBU206391]